MSTEDSTNPTASTVAEPLRRRGDRRTTDEVVATDRRKGDRRTIPGVNALFRTLFRRGPSSEA
jgi:phosphatidate phosphatase APP1